MSTRTMKAITVWQPWATLIALGAKRFETRGWKHNYRGPLAIHAAKSKQGHRICATEPFHTILEDAGYPDPRWLPHGEIVAVCEFFGIYQIVDTTAASLSEQELAFGDWSPGRWAWGLCNVRSLHFPIPARGKQGLWTWDYSGELPAMVRTIESFKEEWV